MKQEWLLLDISHCISEELILLQYFTVYRDVLQTEGVAVTATSKVPNPAEETCDMKRRQARPLTGKHVRPGTGASPATLLSLRRKIQARQQQHDTQKLHK